MSYPLTNTTLRWLEVILSERFGLSWKITRDNEALLLSIDGHNGVVKFDRLEQCFTKASSELLYYEWDAES